jgi:hypothetical protein
MTISSRLHKLDQQLRLNQVVLNRHAAQLGAQTPKEYVEEGVNLLESWTYGTLLDEVQNTAASAASDQSKDGKRRAALQAGRDLFFLDDLLAQTNQQAAEHWDEVDYLTFLLGSCDDMKLLSIIFPSAIVRIGGDPEVARRVGDTYFDGKLILFAGAVQHWQTAQEFLDLAADEYAAKSQTGDDPRTWVDLEGHIRLKLQNRVIAARTASYGYARDVAGGTRYVWEQVRRHREAAGGVRQ